MCDTLSVFTLRWYWRGLNKCGYPSKLLLIMNHTVPKRSKTGRKKNRRKEIGRRVHTNRSCPPPSHCFQDSAGAAGAGAGTPHQDFLIIQVVKLKYLWICMWLAIAYGLAYCLCFVPICQILNWGSEKQTENASRPLLQEWQHPK